MSATIDVKQQRTPEGASVPVEVRAIACEGGALDKTLQELNAEGWAIRQIFHDPPAFRIFAQRLAPRAPRAIAESATAESAPRAIAESRIMDALRATPEGASVKKLVELLGGVMSRSTIDRALTNLDKSGEVARTKVKNGRTFRFVYSVRL
jgi:hypothetical protein